MSTKQQEKSLQTMRELMDSAQALFNSKGFAKTTVAEITDGAGYAKGSFYRHWKSKDELFLDILAAKLGNYREERARRIGEAETLEDVLDVIWDFLDTIVGDRNWSKVFLEFTVHAAGDSELRRKLNKSIYRLSNDIFAEMVGSHVISGYSAKKLGALNTALFEGFLIHDLLETGELSREDVRRAALTMIRTLAISGEASS
ncbi:TetR/AcrR family transcriptional regulator [Salidesulfovibrio brasiliensis]|uniref:TetR/AcrR family transcriptional regulator n=1 Tax=Salidesulfovibrio brasiliensis TaxID=221711 RepID=UPI0006D1B366|nr:TetR/AcrR family transcriptional regulator [Salidesulfovibrio brasiliensis]